MERGNAHPPSANPSRRMREEMRGSTLRPDVSAAGLSTLRSPVPTSSGPPARPLLRDDTNRPEAESPPRPGVPPSTSWSAPRTSRGTTRSLSARPSLPRRRPCRRGAHGAEKHSSAGDAGVLASPKVVRPIALNFEEKTPVKEQPSPARSSALVKKSTTIMPRLVTHGWSFVADRATHLLLHRTRSQRAGST
ncbi:unnamed protein product [Triticum turgidum subsp. durum]|nr:unnamed protein product [Triticum turgidum subsp. durum]